MALNESQKKERSEYLERNLQITECSQKKPYVFISYASDNWETVFKEAVVPLQQTYGLCVYADKAFDKVNDKWIVPMLRNIRGADAVIAFVSQSYIESYACFLELLTAVNNKKPVVFVSLEQELHLGDTTDQPDVERGVKNEILNQGANIATNTNNTSNDLMRAMKSAYTSLSTLLEQDALSKYDISDAFINFFRDASINRKTINDLKAVKRTIGSVSKEVFDKSLISKSEQAVENESSPAEPWEVGETAAQPAAPQSADAPAAQPVIPRDADETAAQPVTSQDAGETSVQSAAPAFRFEDPKKGAGKKKRLAIILAGAACCLAVAIAVVLVVTLPKNVKNKPYITASGEIGLYTGRWHQNQPSGEGKLEYDNGDVYEGTWEAGQRNGQGIMTYAIGAVYDGEWLNDQRSGQGNLSYDDGRFYKGAWKNDQRNGQGVYTYTTGSVYDGNWENDQRNGEGKINYANGDFYDGEWKNDQRDGQGAMKYQDGTVESGRWDEGEFIG